MRRTFATLGLRSAHARVQKVSDQLELDQANDAHVRARVARSGLQLDGGEPEPALKQSPRQVNVLNARVREVDLSTPEDAPTHADPLLVEAVPERVVLEIQWDHGQQKPWPQQAKGQSAQAIEPQQFRVGPGEVLHRIQLWHHWPAPDSSSWDAVSRVPPL